MKSEELTTLKRTLLSAYITAYMVKKRLSKQNARIRELIEKLREAGVKDDEIVDIKLKAFYVANPEERRQ